MSQINVNNIVGKNGASAVSFPHGITVTGVVTATQLTTQNVTGNVTAGSFTGPLTGNVTGNCSGTAGSLAAGATGADLTLSGDLTVNGTTTTIDTAVTAVDSLAVDGSITALGNCGIGTTNPGTKLDVRGGNWANGDIVVGQSGNAGRVKFRRGADGSDSGSIGFSAADNNSVLSMNVASGDGTLTFQTNSTEVVRIDANRTTKFKGPLTEKCNRDTGAGLQGDYNHDLISHGNVHWATSNSVGTWTYNLRGSSTVALNDMMTDGETLSFQLISAQNNASYYMTQFRIDGTAHTVWWQGGSAPSAGGSGGYDVYTFTVFKIANASFRTFASLSNHA